VNLITSHNEFHSACYGAEFSDDQPVGFVRRKIVVFGIQIHDAIFERVSVVVAGIVGVISDNDVLAGQVIFDENRIAIGFEQVHCRPNFLIYCISFIHGSIVVAFACLVSSTIVEFSDVNSFRIFAIFRE
jgi:hypothetical protein